MRSRARLHARRRRSAAPDEMILLMDRIKRLGISIVAMTATAKQGSERMGFEPSMQENAPLLGAGVLRRDCLTSLAAAALGYTLAAGPVRAGVIKTGTEGLSAGAATIPVSGPKCRPIMLGPREPRSRRSSSSPWRSLACMSTSKDVTRRLGALGAFAVAPDIYFRLATLPKSRNRRN